MLDMRLVRRLWRRRRRSSAVRRRLIVLAFLVAVWVILSHPQILAFAILLVAGYLAMRAYRKAAKRSSILAMEIEELDEMPGYDFETYLADLLRRVGFTAVQETKRSGDFGADILARDDSGSVVVVQAKRYAGPVGIKAIQEIVGAREYYRAQRALVVTTSAFTPAAAELAQATRVELWPREALARRIAQLHRS